MPFRRYCSICNMSKQRLNPRTRQMEEDVVRYGLTRQIREKNKIIRQGGWGGIDLCTECWEKHGKINKRNTRPEKKNGIN